MKVLLFDVDGTLIRAGGAGRKSLNRAVWNLFSVRIDCGRLGLAGKTDLRNFTEAAQAALRRKPSRGELAALHREYLRLLPGYVRSALRARKYRLAPGIRRLLRRLSREKGLLLGLGTGNMEHGARIKLEPSGLNAYFLFGGYGSDAFHRPALLKKAVARAQRFANGDRIAPRDVYVIGDTPLDVAAGRAAGYTTVAVGTGFAQWEELVRSRPDHLARDFRRMDQWLGWLGLSKKRKS